MIRDLLDFRQHTTQDVDALTSWLNSDVFPVEHGSDDLYEVIVEWYRQQRIELPSKSQLERIVSSAERSVESKFYTMACTRIPLPCFIRMNELLNPSNPESSDDVDRTPMSELRADPGLPNRESVLMEIAKLARIDEIDLPDKLFNDVPSHVVKKYQQRAASEKPRELRRHSDIVRFTLISFFCWQRRKEIVDGLIELLIQVIHKIFIKSEKKVMKTWASDYRKIHSRTNLLCQIAKAALNNPDGVVKDVLFPVVDEDTLRSLIQEQQATVTCDEQVQHAVRSSYWHHYRRMLIPILDALSFQSNNDFHKPVMEALDYIRNHQDEKSRYFRLEDGLPVDGVIKKRLLGVILEKDTDGTLQINRINYEIVVLQALRDRLRCKEIWVSGADRFRNPDEDLQVDFKSNRKAYYASLHLRLKSNDFVADLKSVLTDSLNHFNTSLPGNPKVRIKTAPNSRISVSPVAPQKEPVNLSVLKSEIIRRWPMTSLLDVIKEADLRIGFSQEFQSTASREVIPRDELSKRLLFCFYGLGTNTGLKRVSASNTGVSYDELLHIRRKYIYKDSLRRAIAKVVNAILNIRHPDIWGEGTTACASDSQKFGAWDQNLMTEWHIRYGGRGVMVYWHVERKSTCIYSQLKRCSSSEVAAMIEGVMRHCTEMSVEKNYVDSHGQSEVAFAFCHLLGFQLLPTLKGISRKKLYRVEPGDSSQYPNLKSILTRPIKWDLIAQQYDEMVKYATALRLGTAESESILRRFTRENVKHPTYQALQELGKVKRTIFICQYLESESLRQEIHEALNVVERWNGTNGFIFFGKGGEVATNRIEDQEISILSLHLLQICLVYVNTLMIQNVLSERKWMKKMVEEDFRALTPLIHAHVNPYGTFELDMEKRLQLDAFVNVA